MAVTFVNYKEIVITGNGGKRLKTRKVAFAANVSYFVYNQSFINPALVRIMVSPDGRVWMADGLKVEVNPGGLAVLVPNYFSKYLTLEYKSGHNDCPATLSVWFQMTRPPAKKCYGVGNDRS